MYFFSLSLIQNPSRLRIITDRAEPEPATAAGKSPTLFYTLPRQILISWSFFLFGFGLCFVLFVHTVICFS